MNPEDIKALVDQLLKTGEVLATKAFELALRQNYVYVATDIITLLLCIPLGIFSYKAAKKGFAEEYKSTEADMAAQIFGTFGAALSVITGAVCLVMAVARLINPEWYAIKLLLETVTGS